MRACKSAKMFARCTMIVYIVNTCIGKLSVEEGRQLDLVGIRTKSKDEAQDSSTSRRRWGTAVLTDPSPPPLTLLIPLP